ncbi:MAG: HD domain-containing protein [Actinomycetota bacterium]|nr:HD domain-containing protein [Actinomycetota bacterium]
MATRVQPPAAVAADVPAPVRNAYAAVPMGLAREFGSLRHLAARFFGALSPAGPSTADEAWARACLLPGEQVLWDRMSGPDRRHAVGVARHAAGLLGDRHAGGDGGDPPGRAVLASALLHDVGKVESDLGTFARVAVTAAAVAVGRRRLAAQPTGTATASRWRRWRDLVRLYLTHDQVGAALLERAGSDPMTVSWAREHHTDPSRWTVDRRIGDALRSGDGD